MTEVFEVLSRSHSNCRFYSSEGAIKEMPDDGSDDDGDDGGGGDDDDDDETLKPSC